MRVKLDHNTLIYFHALALRFSPCVFLFSTDSLGRFDWHVSEASVSCSRELSVWLARVDWNAHVFCPSIGCRLWHAGSCVILKWGESEGSGLEEGPSHTYSSQWSPTCHSQQLRTVIILTWAVMNLTKWIKFCWWRDRPGQQLPNFLPPFCLIISAFWHFQKWLIWLPRTVTVGLSTDVSIETSSFGLKHPPVERKHTFFREFMLLYEFRDCSEPLFQEVWDLFRKKKQL